MLELGLLDAAIDEEQCMALVRPDAMGKWRREEEISMDVKHNAAQMTTEDAHSSLWAFAAADADYGHGSVAQCTDANAEHEAAGNDAEDWAWASTQTTKLTALEIRRRKNRESMRRLRQRQRAMIEGMKQTVVQLEQEYQTLCRIESEQKRSGGASPSGEAHVGGSQQEEDPQMRRYYAAQEDTRRFGAENLYLKAVLQEHSHWKQELERVLESPAGYESTHRSAELDAAETDVVRKSFGFRPLSQQQMEQVILDSSSAVHHIHAHFSISNHVMMPDDGTQGSKEAFTVFGWHVFRQLEGSEMKFVFWKDFHHVLARDVMERTWHADLNLKQFQRIKSETRRLDILQIVNDHAVVLGRDVRHPDDRSVFRTVFLRFRMEKILSGSTIGRECERGLFQHAYVIGTQSMNPPDRAVDDSSNKSRFSVLMTEENERLVWADMTLWMEFLTYADDPTHCRVRWTGRTDYKSPIHAYRSAIDTLSALLRWEAHTIAPPLVLLPSDLPTIVP